MATWGFYSNSALTSEYTELPATTYPSTDLHVYYGSLTTGVKLEAESDPGVDDLEITIADSATGSGHAVTAVKLATTQGGLDSATGGAALTIDTELLGGTANAFEFWVRVTDAVGQPVASTELSLVVTDWVESAV